MTCTRPQAESQKILDPRAPSTHDPKPSSAGPKSRSAAVSCLGVMCYPFLSEARRRRAVKRRDYPPSAPMRQIGDFWLIVAFSRSEDETEIRAGERTGDTSREEHPSRDAATLLGGRQDPFARSSRSLRDCCWIEVYPRYRPQRRWSSALVRLLAWETASAIY